MRKTVVICFASNHWYPRGQQRLKDTLKHFEAPVDFLGFSNYKEIGSPTHQEVPYAFKIYSILKAMEKGYERLIYADASIYAVKPIEPLLEIIEKQGYYFEEAGQWTGVWCKDTALKTLGVTRDQAMKIPMFSAGFTCLDCNNDRARQFFNTWYDYARDGVTFTGPWTNKNNEASRDKRVMGHRHDMTAASVLAHRLKMKLSTAGTFLAYIGPGYSKPNDSVLFHLRPG